MNKDTMRGVENQGVENISRVRDDEEDEDNEEGEEEEVDTARSTTRSVHQPANGASTVLHYPIVTTAGTRRKPSVNKPLSARSNHRRTTSLSATLKKKTKEFLGLEDDEDGDREFLWTERRIRLANRKYGGVDLEAVARTLPKPPRRGDRVDTPDGGPVSYPFTSTYPR